MPGGHNNALGSGPNTSGHAKHHESQDSKLSKSKQVSELVPDENHEIIKELAIISLQKLRDVQKESWDKKLKRVQANVEEELAKRDAQEKGEGSKTAGDKTTTPSTPPKLPTSTSSKPSASTPAAATSSDSGAKTDNTENAGNTENKKKKKKSKGKKKPDSASTRSRPHSREPPTRK